MAGLVDYLRFVMGWWSSEPAAPPTPGTFYVAKVQEFVPGAIRGEAFAAGAKTHNDFVAGATKAQAT